MQSHPAAHADTAVAGTRVVVTDTALILARGAARGRLPLAGRVGADSALRATLVDARPAGGRFYALVYVVGAVRAPTPRVDQGAATPAADAPAPCTPTAGLVWAAFDAALRVRRVRTFTTAAPCDLVEQLAPSSADSAPAIVRGVVAVRYYQKPGGWPHDVTYDTRRPERGPRDVERPDHPCDAWPRPAGSSRAAAAGDLRVRVERETHLVISRGARIRRLALARVVGAPPWNPCVGVADVQTRGDRAYVLLRAAGTSRLGITGYCGAGEEDELILLALGPDLRVRRRQAELTNSCLDSREGEGDGDARVVRGRLRVGYTRYRNDSTYHLAVRYDGRTPARGLRVDTLSIEP